MSWWEKFKKSISQNTNLWTILWILVLVNILALLSLGGIITTMRVVVVIFLGAAGGLAIRLLANFDLAKEELPPTVKDSVFDLMGEIKPICEQVFDRETNRLITPAMENLHSDFHKGLSWLWEDLEDFLLKVEENAADTRSVLHLVTALTDDKFKTVKKLFDNLDFVDSALEGMEEARAKDFEDLGKCLEQEGENLRQSVGKEKEIFYDYIYRLLVEQVKEQDDPREVVDYFDVYKLGDQFSLIIEKSLQTRLANFQDIIVHKLEEFSADVVGRMQKNTMHLMNTFKENQELLERLKEECRGESSLILKRLGECQSKSGEMKEQAGEIMITLAWQDILVEKRWQEIKEKIYEIKDHVIAGVDDDVVPYINSILKEEIPGLSQNPRDSQSAVLYKTLLDGELIYQLFKGDKLLEVIRDGVYSLLQFIRPVEMVALRNIRLTDEGIHKRKTIKADVKAGKYQEQFNQVMAAVKNYNPLLANFLPGVMQGLYTFCSNPYIKQKPGNLDQAAWSLFMVLIDDESQDQEVYLLVGLLLAIHQVRNQHIHPLKSSPLELKDKSHLEIMRQACYKAISIIISREVRGITRMVNKLT